MFWMLTKWIFLISRTFTTVKNGDDFFDKVYFDVLNTAIVNKKCERNPTRFHWQPANILSVVTQNAYTPWPDKSQQTSLIANNHS